MDSVPSSLPRALSHAEGCHSLGSRDGTMHFGETQLNSTRYTVRQIYWEGEFFCEDQW